MIETDQDDFYLKITPEMLFLESKLLQHFQRQHCKNTSVVLSENNEFQCFLMPSSGHESLREYFKGKVSDARQNAGPSPASLPFLAVTQGRAAQSCALDVSLWKADKRVARG